MIAPAPTESGVIAFVRSLGLFPPDALLGATQIGDGNVNFVWRVADLGGAGSLVVKQAVPYFKAAGVDHPLSIERARLEADALELQHRLAPGLVPVIRHRADTVGITVMEDLSGLLTMRRAMLERQRFPRFADDISTFLARLAFYTSDHFLSSAAKRDLQRRFTNSELCKITEDLMFSDPYRDCERNHVNPALRPYLERVFWRRDDVRLAAALLKQKFLALGQSLVHGDLHTGSIFASESRTIVFDPEFAFVGPSAFDLGKLLGNIAINYMSWRGKDVPAVEYRAHLIDLIVDTERAFAYKLGELLAAETRDAMARTSGYREHYLRELFLDTLGYCAIAMIRRMHGLARNIDVESIEDPERRAAVQIAVLELASTLLVERHRMTRIEELARLLEHAT